MAHHAPRPTAPALLALAALAALLAAACGKGNRTDPFPLEVGFQPLEPTVDAATLPPPVAGDDHPQGLGPIVAVSTFAHWGSHGRGYLHAPLARVYQALGVPAASYIHNFQGGTRRDGPDVLGVEPFPVSFRVRYLDPNQPVVGDVLFEVTYRGGPLEGTEQAPLRVGLRYQKTWGTSYISVMSGSLVATPVDGAPDVTAVEMVEWLQATTQGQADCDGTLADLFGDLEAVLASLP
jgi:hypothetical protein